METESERMGAYSRTVHSRTGWHVGALGGVLRIASGKDEYKIIAGFWPCGLRLVIGDYIVPSSITRFAQGRRLLNRAFKSHPISARVALRTCHAGFSRGLFLPMSPRHVGPGSASSVLFSFWSRISDDIP